MPDFKMSTSIKKLVRVSSEHFKISYDLEDSDLPAVRIEQGTGGFDQTYIMSEHLDEFIAVLMHYKSESGE